MTTIINFTLIITFANFQFESSVKNIWKQDKEQLSFYEKLIKAFSIWTDLKKTNHHFKIKFKPYSIWKLHLGFIICFIIMNLF